MSEELMIRHCSPTLAGLKTGNLFTYRFETKDLMYDTIRNWNKRIIKKGLRMLPMRYKNGIGLIYIYRTSYLSRDFQRKEVQELLAREGYPGCSIAECLSYLRLRLEENEDFPHEIGLFLGYPPEDVLGFIENKAQNFKCVGCWKVYGNEEHAKKIFDQYKKCTEIYHKHHIHGRDIESLIVAC